MSGGGRPERYEEYLEHIIAAIAKGGASGCPPRYAERRLLALLRSGLESGDGIPVTRSYWARKRKALGRSRA